jgi:pimeloyl-ACP methyl ester carboxylesterase
VHATAKRFSAAGFYRSSGNGPARRSGDRPLSSVCVRRLLLTVLFALALAAPIASAAHGPALFSVYPVAHPRGLMVTSGGWAYCLQVQRLARASGYTLLCGRYAKDGYTGYGLRAKRHLDWGDPAYLASLAAKAAALHRTTGGKLVLIGVSYSGYGVAVLAAHHPELRPERLIVIDSYFDLVARRAALQPDAQTAKEIDVETGGTVAALRARSAGVAGLAKLVRDGTELIDVWSVAPEETSEFRGATCDRNANAGVLEAVAAALDRPVVGWVTQSRHGHDLWDSGRRIIAGDPPGHATTFAPGKPIPPGSNCA